VSEIKLCKDCKHVRGTSPRYLKCAYRLSPVNGLAASFCVHEREPREDRCGPDGRFFEPKPAKPWWRFW